MDFAVFHGVAEPHIRERKGFKIQQFVPATPEWLGFSAIKRPFPPLLRSANWFMSSCGGFNEHNGRQKPPSAPDRSLVAQGAYCRAAASQEAGWETVDAARPSTRIEAGEAIRKLAAALPKDRPFRVTLFGSAPIQIAVDLFRPSFDEDQGHDMANNCRRLWPIIFGREIDPRVEIIAPALEKRRIGYGEPIRDYKQELRDGVSRIDNR